MKSLFSILLISVVSFGMAQTTPTQPAPLDPANGPIIKFTETLFAFGEIKQGDVVEHVFKFKNEGNAPLILSNVQTTCGCTAPQWPRETAIAPGEMGEIKVVFNSRGKMGTQSKTITVMSNAQNSTERVRISAVILAPPTPPATEDGSKR
jgi:hypothetical protein